MEVKKFSKPKKEKMNEKRSISIGETIDRYRIIDQTKNTVIVRDLKTNKTTTLPKETLQLILNEQNMSFKNDEEILQDLVLSLPEPSFRKKDKMFDSSEHESIKNKEKKKKQTYDEYKFVR